MAALVGVFKCVRPVKLGFLGSDCAFYRIALLEYKPWHTSTAGTIVNDQNPRKGCLAESLPAIISSAVGLPAMALAIASFVAS